MATPKQIKKQVAAAEKQHKELYAVADKPTEDTPAEVPAEGTTAEVPTAAPPAEATAEKPAQAPEVPTPAPAPEPEIGSDAWKQKYSTLQGKFDVEVPRLHDENAALRQQLSSMQAVLSNVQPAEETPVQPGEKFIKEKDIEDYGEDMLDVVRRAAREEFMPEIARLQADNENLRNNLGTMSTGMAQSAKGNMFSQLAARVPNWKEVNKSQPFLDWLGGQDVYSGYSRQQMLTQAFEAGDAARVIAFFEGYTKEQTVVQTETQGQRAAPVDPLDTLVAPGQPMATGAASAPQGNIWTQTQVKEFYADVAKGRFKGRDDVKKAYEQDIVAASNQGRIIG